MKTVTVKKFKQQKRVFAIVLILPALLIIIGVFGYPMVYAFRISLFSFNLIRSSHEMRFVGLQNFIDLLRNPDFYSSMLVTFKFLLLSIPFELALGISIALILNNNIPGRKYFRGLFLVPWMLTPVVAGLIWLYMYDYDLGTVNYLLQSIGIHKVRWLSNLSVALVSVAIASIWRCTPFVILFVLSGLEALPEEPYEAAVVDGASRLQIFFYLTIPFLKPVILIVLLLRIIDAYRVFGLIVTLTDGGPGSATEVASIFVYKNGFKFWNVGYAAAASYIVMIVIFIFGIAYLRLKKSGLGET